MLLLEMGIFFGELTNPTFVYLLCPIMLQCLKNFLRGPSIKDVHTLGGRGSGKSGQMRTREGGRWLAKCGRPLEKKIIATIFVKFTQIIWQYVCI